MLKAYTVKNCPKPKFDNICEYFVVPVAILYWVYSSHNMAQYGCLLQPEGIAQPSIVATKIQKINIFGPLVSLA